MCHVRPTIPLRELFYVLYQGKKVKRLAFFKSFLKFVWFFKNDNFSTQKKEEFSIILITYDDYCSITKNLWLKGDEQPNEIISAILCKPLHMKSLSSSLRTQHTQRDILIWHLRKNEWRRFMRRTFLEKQIIKIKLCCKKKTLIGQELCFKKIWTLAQIFGEIND